MVEFPRRLDEGNTLLDLLTILPSREGASRSQDSRKCDSSVDKWRIICHDYWPDVLNSASSLNQTNDSGLKVANHRAITSRCVGLGCVCLSAPGPR